MPNRKYVFTNSNEEEIRDTKIGVGTMTGTLILIVAGVLGGPIGLAIGTGICFGIGYSLYES